jgi:hypothetical protein
MSSRQSKTSTNQLDHIDLSEWDRISKLSQKLVHSLCDVRQRAARNLLNKFQRGLYQNCVFPNALGRQLIVNINDSLCLLSAIDGDTMSAQDLACLKDVLHLVHLVFSSITTSLLDNSHSLTLKQHSSDPVCILLDNLYILQRAKSVVHDESLMEILTEVELCFLHV